MANKGIDFSMQLPQGENPSAANGGLLVSAGQTEGQASVVEAQGNVFAQGVNDNLLKQGATVAMDAAKGYLDSKLHKDVANTDNALEVSTKADTALRNYDILEQSGAEPADLAAAKAEVEKYSAALQQGTITREQALLHIDKTVKDLSNVLPGYGSELRKLATTLTGVEHMGNYREVGIFSKASAADKARQAQIDFLQKTNEKMITDFVDKYKRLPQGGLNGRDMAIFRDEAALAARAESLKAQTGIRGSTLTLNEPVVEDLVNTRLAQGILTMNQRLQTVVNAVDASGKPVDFTPENRIVLRQKVLGDIGTFFEGLKAEVLGFNSNQLSAATRETMLTRINTQQRDLVDSLKNQDSFDDFNKTMKLNSDKAADIMAKWAIANPHLKIMKESGMITPDVTKLWIDKQRDPKSAAEFRKIYGNAMDDFFRSVTLGGPAVAENFANNAVAASRDPEHLDSLKKTDPGQYQAQMHTLAGSLKTVAKEGWGQDVATQNTRKAQFGTWLESFARQIDPSKPDMVKAWGDLVSDPMMATRIKELPEQDQLRAVYPIVEKTHQILENGEMGLFRQLGKLQTSIANGFMGGTIFDVVVNPITGLFEAKAVQQGKATSGETPGGAITGRARLPTSPQERTLGSGQVTTLLQRINTSMATLNNFKDIPGVVPEEMKGKVAVDYLNKFNAGFFNLSGEDRAAALNRTSVVPSGGNPQEVKVRLHENNIEMLSGELRNTKDPKARKILMEELDKETTLWREALNPPKQ